MIPASTTASESHATWNEGTEVTSSQDPSSRDYDTTATEVAPAEDLSVAAGQTVSEPGRTSHTRVPTNSLGLSTASPSTASRGSPSLSPPALAAPPAGQTRWPPAPGAEPNPFGSQEPMSRWSPDSSQEGAQSRPGASSSFSSEDGRVYSGGRNANSALSSLSGLSVEGMHTLPLRRPPQLVTQASAPQLRAGRAGQKRPAGSGFMSRGLDELPEEESDDDDDAQGERGEH